MRTGRYRSTLAASLVVVQVLLGGEEVDDGGS